MVQQVIADIDAQLEELVYVDALKRSLWVSNLKRD
jgi:hypothetical protein